MGEQNTAGEQNTVGNQRTAGKKITKGSKVLDSRGALYNHRTEFIKRKGLVAFDI